MGKLTEAAGYGISQIWRDAAHLHGLGYTDAAEVLSLRAVDLCEGNVEGLCSGCGRPKAAAAAVKHQPWCLQAVEGYDPTEDLELELLRKLWDEPDTPAIFGEPGTRDREWRDRGGE